MGIKKGLAIGAAAALGGLAGSYIGSALGGNELGSNNMAMGKTGAIAGAVGFGGLTAAVVHPKIVGKALGQVGLTSLEAIGTLSIAGEDLLGTAAIGAAEGTAYLAKKVGAPLAVTAAEKYGTTASGFVSKLVKPNNGKIINELMPYKLSKLGVGMVAGTGLISGTKEAFNDFNQHRMGQMDPMIYRATPRTPSYANNGGATGDLVFAMNRNRRG